MLIVVLLSVANDDCRYAECRGTCPYAECDYAECRGAINSPSNHLYCIGPGQERKFTSYSEAPQVAKEGC
jgi:hypothetical protein